MQVGLSRPNIRQQDIDAVVQVLQSGRLSIGPMIREFERLMAEYNEVRHAVAVNSGTSALHLLVRALGITEGNEVITTPFSFVASANCVLYERAAPVFVDIDPNTLNIDINSIEEKITDKTKAILPVDVFGHPLDMQRINELARKHNLRVIEDACEAIGAQYLGAKAGTTADAGVFAFYPNKQITTGEGGVIVTNDDTVAEMCRSMRSQGRAITGQWLHHERLGFNYRMSELHAALGVAQLARLDQILDKRQQIAETYSQRLGEVDGISIPFIDKNVTRMSWFAYVVRLDENIDRIGVMEYLNQQGIGCKPYFTPIHLQPYMRRMFGYKEGDFPITERVARSTLALPFYTALDESQINYVVDTLKRAVTLCRK